MPSCIKHDDVVVLFEFFGDAQPGQPILIEAMQEQQRGLLASRAIVVLAYAVGKDVTFAPRCRGEFLDGAVGFYNCLQAFLLFVHHRDLAPARERNLAPARGATTFLAVKLRLTVQYGCSIAIMMSFLCRRIFRLMDSFRF